MNNPDATRFVQRRLTDAGIGDQHVDVRSRDMGNVADPAYRYTVRTCVYLGAEHPMPQRLGARIGRILDDLPGSVRTDVDDLHVVTYWDGDV
jgi:hypothetical protein